VVVLARTLAGAVSLGSFTFLTGAFNRSRAYIEKILSGFNDISEQAVFLKDLFDFFAMQPTICAPSHAIRRRVRSARDLNSATWGSPTRAAIIW
jgi:ATP-binding cassette subfamily B protein